MNSFGAGFLVGKALATTANPNPTPRKFGQLQEVSVDDSFEEKRLFGANSAPVRAFRGQRKIDLKAKSAKINANAFAEIYYAASVTAGAVLYTFNEMQTIPGSVAYTLTALNAGAAGVNFIEDLGVEYAANGNPLKLVTSAPTVGQYSQALGTYTFAAADASAVVLLNYSYNSATVGYTISVPNLAQQEAPYFECILFNPTDGGYGKRFFKVTSNKLNLQFKQGEIMIPEFDMSVYDPGTGILFQDCFGAA
jgi:hypothetical protein